MAREEYPSATNKSIYDSTSRLQKKGLLPPVIQAQRDTGTPLHYETNLVDSASSSENEKNKEARCSPLSDVKQKIKGMYARNLLSSVNTESQLKGHHERVGKKIITRFPPEPNGYLHIGHAKAMRLSFLAAEAFGGDCLLRYDDTNPNTAHANFAEMIKENVEWLGYKPTRVTYASDFFPEMFSLARDLIRKDLAYICSQTPEEMSEFRKRKENSPYRDRPFEESLELFEKMQNDEKVKPSSLTLRLKIDQKHPNPTLRDPVAYRIPLEAPPHFRTGRTWRTYPTYDFAQCICDSLQDVTHSLCTLEFEIRRELYYWILDQLDMYKPYVWEFSRLNLSNTLVSKRHIKRLISMKTELDKNQRGLFGEPQSKEVLEFLKEKGVSGWDDPRLVTIAGMRRRGIPASVLNEFVDHVSFTRRGNENVTMREVLDGILRKRLNESSKRFMVVSDPVKAFVLEEGSTNSESRRESNISKEVLIERSDIFSVEGQEAPPDFYGLTQESRICLKGWSKEFPERDSSGVFTCQEIVKDAQGRVLSVILKPEPLETTKALGRPKGNLHWLLADDVVVCEVRLYEDLLKSEMPDLKNLEEELNLNSLQILSGAVMPKKLSEGSFSISFLDFSLSNRPQKRRNLPV